MQKDLHNMRHRKSLQSSLAVRDDFWEADNPADNAWPIVDRSGVWPFIWNKLIRRDLLTEHNVFFPSELSVGEDGVFVHCLLKHVKKVSFLHEPLYHYRYQRKDSATVTTSQDTVKRFCHHIEAVRIMLREFSKNEEIWQDGRDLLEWCIRFLYGDFVFLPVDIRKGITPVLAELFGRFPATVWSQNMNHITKKRLENMITVPVNFTRTTRLLNILQTKIENRIMRLQRIK